MRGDARLAWEAGIDRQTGESPVFRARAVQALRDAADTSTVIGGTDLQQLALGGASLSDQRAALETALMERGANLESAGKVLAFAEPAIAMWATDRPTSSWLGGDGMLPRGAQWPLNRADEPMRSIAALDLGDLPPIEGLPPKGVLSIFVDGSWPQFDDFDFVESTRVFLSEAPVRHEPPPESYPSGPYFLKAASMPIPGCPNRVMDSIAGAERDLVIEAMNEIAPEAYAHQLLGRPREFQGDVASEIPYWLSEASPVTRSRFGEDEQDPERWRLLAEIDAEGEMMFGDGGNLYVMVPTRDLDSRRFDRVMGIEQGA